jgi:hypothetical protein
VARIPPEPSRVAVHREPGAVRAVARAPRNPGFAAFLAVWLVTWAAGEAYAVEALVAGDLPDGLRAFVVLWLAAWSYGGARALAQLAWLAAGREELRLDERSLTVRQVAGPFRGTREYELAAVRNVREDASLAGAVARAFSMSYPGRVGVIAFDYGARTVRVGAGLEGEDVGKVLGLLRERTPTAAAARGAPPSADPPATRGAGSAA